ncbi:MAG: hypothetical protein LPD71_11885 [Shewanella sp.]|nr:hypothetical protein [Shewanella sp.]MCF1430373.1 hypothetical protein [Shewanella sp.]MCF1439409.1 hypothetical protein [Shewanella sp.]MCF1457961.1 hypothetical protein [Shewanella sp.]
MMKALVTAATLAMVFSAGATAETTSSPAREDGQTQFWVKLKGEVPKRCLMTTSQDTTLELELAKGNNSEFEFKAWCNGQTTNGLLVVGADALKNENGTDIIPLLITYNGEGGTVNAANNAGVGNRHAVETSIVVSNSTTGDMGENKVVKIQPELNGFEKAGNYQTDMYVSLYPR